MIRFSLDSIDDRTAAYTFLPENDASVPGKAMIDRESGEVSVVEESSADFNHVYAGHMFSKLREFNESGRFEESGYAIWW